jgi:predicted dehydrogenase
VAAASLLAGLGPRMYAGESNTIKLALIGCGGRGTGAVADAFAAKGGPVKLVAMADLFKPRLDGSFKNLQKVAADKVDVPPERRFVGFDAYKKAIDCLGPGDVALLTTHAAFRPMMFEYAVKKGVNVFAEKSFATDAPAARRWLKAAELSERKGLKVGVGFMWRHSQARQETVKRIRDGAIGDVHTLRIYRVHGPVNCPPLPKDANELVFQLQHPNSFTWVSSGFFIDWHCHNVDAACWAKGAWPVAAQAFGGRCYEAAGSQFDHYTVEYTFADGTKLFAFSRHMSDRGHDMTDENLVWDFGRNDPNPYHVEWQVLLDAIRQDKPHNEARRAGQAEVAAVMGRAATHTGQYVTWDQVMDSDFEFVKDIDSMTFETEAPIHPGPNGIYAAPQPGITKEL